MAERRDRSEHGRRPTRRDCCQHAHLCGERLVRETPALSREIHPELKEPAYRKISERFHKNPAYFSEVFARADR
jgi:hypothetical protein